VFATRDMSRLHGNNCFVKLFLEKNVSSCKSQNGVFKLFKKLVFKKI
jgi:hypothetical protein